MRMGEQEMHPGRQDEVVLWYATGTELASINRFEDSIVCFNRVLEIDEHYLKALVAKANSLDRLGRFAEDPAVWPTCRCHP